MRLFYALGVASLVLVTPARAEDCLARATSGSVEERLAAAEAALEVADADGFQQAVEELALLQPCLGDRPVPRVAARLHRIVGVQAFVTGDRAKAEAAFAAARVLDPTYNFPTSLYSADSDLRRLYESLPSAPAPTSRVPEPRDARLAFDGILSLDRPKGRASLVQLLSPTLDVTSTTYVLPEEKLPAYTAIPRIRNTLLVATAAAVACSAGSYAAAWATRGDFERDEPSYDRSDLDRFQAQATALLVVSGSFAVVGVGTGVGALAVGER